jgi:hypothetical protein
VALLATLTAAVDIATPTNLVSGGTAVIEWAGATPDVFTIELCNTNLFVSQLIRRSLYSKLFIR